MAIKQFPNELYALVMQTGQNLVLGNINVAETTELAAIGVHLAAVGPIEIGRTLQLKLFTGSSKTVERAASATVDMATLDNYGPDWLGVIRFSFPRTILNPDTTYQAQLVPVSYTRDLNNSYVAAISDYPVPTNGISTAAKLEVFGYR